MYFKLYLKCARLSSHLLGKSLYGGCGRSFLQPFHEHKPGFGAILSPKSGTLSWRNASPSIVNDITKQARAPSASHGIPWSSYLAGEVRIPQQSVTVRMWFQNNWLELGIGWRWPNLVWGNDNNLKNGYPRQHIDLLDQISFSSQRTSGAVQYLTAAEL